MLTVLALAEPVDPLRHGLPVTAGEPLITETRLTGALDWIGEVKARAWRALTTLQRRPQMRTWTLQTNHHRLTIRRLVTPDLRAASRRLGGTALGSVVRMTDTLFAVVTRDGLVLVYDVETLAEYSRTQLAGILATADPAIGIRDVEWVSTAEQPRHETPIARWVASVGTAGNGPPACTGVRLLFVAVSTAPRPPAVTEPQVLWNSGPCAPNRGAYGALLAGRLVVTESALYLSLGDVGAPTGRTHGLGLFGSELFGAVVLFPAVDGVPRGEPRVYSRGFRNPAGLIDAKGRLWVANQGPQGGDTLSLLHEGADYGWPRVSSGREYAFSGFPAPHEFRPGVTPASYTWVPSPAVSALAVNQTATLPRWYNDDGVGDLLVTSLKGRRLDRCRLGRDALTVVYCEPIVIGERLRDVLSMPRALIMLSDNGSLYAVRADD